MCTDAYSALGTNDNVRVFRLLSDELAEALICLCWRVKTELNKYIIYRAYLVYLHDMVERLGKQLSTCPLPDQNNEAGEYSRGTDKMANSAVVTARVSLYQGS